MDDDWCLLSDDDNEFVTLAPPRDDDGNESEPESEPAHVLEYDESESESELVATLTCDTEPTTVSSSPAFDIVASTTKDDDDDDGDSAISLDDIDISTLLIDAPALDRPPTRAFVSSLLTSEHRSCRANDGLRVGRCIETHACGATDAGMRRGNVREAFSAPRIASFPLRLHAAMPSRQQRQSVPTASVDTPTYTPVTAITRDMGTQVDACVFDESLEPAPQAARLQSALTRSMRATDALKRMAQDHELLAIRLARTDALIERNEHRHARDAFKLERLASGLELAKTREQQQQQQLATLTSEIETLRAENAALQQLDARASTMLELEQLERVLTQRVDSVRQAMRTQYMRAIALAQDDDSPHCVVCLAARATVQLLPCRHQVVCSVCALRVAACPLDSEVVHDKVLTFGLSAYAA